MNILYLSELNPLVCSGGGEIILRRLLDKFKKNGANVVIRTTNDDQQETLNLLKEVDFIFCADMFNEPMNPYAKWFDDLIINEIIEQGNYLTFETGYTGGCAKDYTPCNLTARVGCPDCPKNIYLRRSFFKNAKLNVFLSPLQAGLFTRHFDLTVSKRYICPPEIEHELFYNMNIERDIELLWVGVVCNAKGYVEFKKYAQQNKIANDKILIVGDSILGEPSIGTYIQKMPREELIKVYNRSKKFWSSTLWCEAFGMTTLEAIKCGCDPIFNKNNGCMSYFKYSIEKAKEYSNNDSCDNLFKRIKEQ